MPYLSIIIPAYNEAGRLPQTLETAREFLRNQSYSYEIIVVDDGSNDTTATVVEEKQKHFPQLILIKNAVNKGKGGVVRQGMLAATGDYRIFMDADNSTSIEELPKLMEYIPKFDLVIGSRYLSRDSVKLKQPLLRRFVSRLANGIIQIALLPGIVDTQCGFKLFSSKAVECVFRKQSMSGWSFDIELLTIARLNGLAIKEVPVDWYNSQNSTFHASKDFRSFLQEFGQILNNRRHGVYLNSKE